MAHAPVTGVLWLHVLRHRRVTWLSLSRPALPRPFADYYLIPDEKGADCVAAIASHGTQPAAVHDLTANGLVVGSNHEARLPCVSSRPARNLRGGHVSRDCCSLHVHRRAFMAGFGFRL